MLTLVLNMAAIYVVRRFREGVNKMATLSRKETGADQGPRGGIWFWLRFCGRKVLFILLS